MSELKEEIIKINPTHIMSWIGRTHDKIEDIIYTMIDYLEQPTKIKENICDNLYLPMVLAKKNQIYGYLLYYGIQP